MLYIKNVGHGLLHLITTPFILSLIIPLLVFDIWIEIYHRINFPVYKIKYIKRNKFVVIDRHKLKYLNWRQKLLCVYCGYANGVIKYWAAIASASEKYWCGIEHEKNQSSDVPKHHKYFARYGDKKDLDKRYGNRK